ncbi:MAG: DUF3054 domain-containing protein [Thermoflexales bacterium]|nr:DUF3054 domain-containing protein [Thermoflexales bacterium]
MTISSRRNTLILMAGDLAIFVMFALVGRETHASSDPNLIVNALPTLLPLILIWTLASVPMGVYRPNVYRFVPLTIIRTLAAWIVTGPIALYARALLLARTAIPVPFIVVTMGLNGALLLAWHIFLAWWLGRSCR